MNPRFNQIKNFLIHLRLHYQFFILSGGYLLGALFVDEINQTQFWLQFLNVHVLLFGGATAYNSWWDKDEGPIGGLKSPPKMNRWMWPASLILQFTGLGWALTVNWNYALIYGLSMLFFWLYSTPLARWKGKPILSLAAIGISTGTNSFFLGFLAAGGYPITFLEDFIAFGVACIVLSLYPASQVYQREEDQQRGDRTFAIRFGLKGVKWLFTILFIAGSILITLGLSHVDEILARIFGNITLIAFFLISFIIWKLEGKPQEYGKVMKVKFFASFCFVMFIISALVIRTLEGAL
ncbi:MAG: UbiA family prenyltransferase [Balneolaceae bacterium]